MTHTIETAVIRAILNSGGEPAAEADIALVGGATGRASAPAAVSPGRRERPRTCWLDLRSAAAPPEVTRFLARLPRTTFAGQADFDAALDAAELGSDVALSLSLAFARAAAAEAGVSIVEYIARIASTRPSIPHPIVAVISGGIHGMPGRRPFQQIMAVPATSSAREDVVVALDVYREVEARLRESRMLNGYSPSSGMLAKGLGVEDSFELILEAAARCGVGDRVEIAVDVAAEHLRTSDGRYRFGAQKITADEALDELTRLTEIYPITYLEDPFDAADILSWQELTRRLAGRTLVVGDDLFATNACYIDSTCAGGVLLKMNQAGTLSATLLAARVATDAGMALCVSHRSLETEDVFVVHLAIALGAGLIKLGGPRRGDRVSRYNELLRLDELFG